jgi:hypothetical protein
MSVVALRQSRSRGMVLHSGPIVFRGILLHPLGRGLEVVTLPRNCLAGRDLIHLEHLASRIRNVRIVPLGLQS